MIQELNNAICSWSLFLILSLIVFCVEFIFKDDYEKLQDFFVLRDNNQAQKMHCVSHWLYHSQMTHGPAYVQSSLEVITMAGWLENLNWAFLDHMFTSAVKSAMSEPHGLRIKQGIFPKEMLSQKIIHSLID